MEYLFLAIFLVWLLGASAKEPTLSDEDLEDWNNRPRTSGNGW